MLDNNWQRKPGDRSWPTAPHHPHTVIATVLSGPVERAMPVRVFVNGVGLGPAAQGRVVGGVLMVPVRAVAEALGAEVRWEPVESCVYITTAEAATEETEPAPPDAG